MGIKDSIGDLTDKAKAAVKGREAEAGKVVDAAGDKVDDATGDKFKDHVDKGQTMAKDAIKKAQ